MSTFLYLLIPLPPTPEDRSSYKVRHLEAAKYLMNNFPATPTVVEVGEHFFHVESVTFRLEDRETVIRAKLNGPRRGQPSDQQVAAVRAYLENDGGWVLTEKTGRDPSLL